MLALVVLASWVGGGVGQLMTSPRPASSGGGLPTGTILTENDLGIQTEADAYIVIE